MSSNNSEQFKNKSESSFEVSKSAQEQLEKLKKQEKPEIYSKTAEEIEKVQKEAIEVASKSETTSKIIEKEQPLRRGPISKRQADESYKKIMNQVQNELSPISRSFSKIIHNKTIEKTSEAIANTVARPNAILAGAFVAFVVTLLTYTIAKTIGYSLSGFETIAAFTTGWIIGVLYDYLKVVITGKK